MIDAYETTTCRALLIIVLVSPNFIWAPGLQPAKSSRVNVTACCWSFPVSYGPFDFCYRIYCFLSRLVLWTL